MDVNTDDLSAFLTRAWNNAQETANTLLPQLEAEQQQALTMLASGSVASLSKNTASQSYGGYNPGNLTHRQITNIFTTLIRQYQTLKDKLTCAIEASDDFTEGVPADYDYDPDIYALLTKYFQVSTQAARLPDITDLRFAPNGARLVVAA